MILRLLDKLLFLTIIVFSFFDVQAQDSALDKSLSTKYSNSNQQFGIAFDIETVNKALITSFDLRFTSTGSTTVDIYYKKGSCNGFIATESAWTKLASTVITVTNIQLPVQILLPHAQLLDGQETGAFYIISTAIYISYGTGSALGQEITHDAILTLKQGYGTAKPAFRAGTISYAPRTFNGTVHYLTGAPLPVTLISFTGQNYGSTNRLRWQTASEINNAYFVAERSADGQVFAPLGTVAAAGASQQPHVYTYVDADATPPSRWYYRLRQVDYSGATNYSSVIVLTSSHNTLTTYPNPVQNELCIALAPDTTYPLTLQLHTASGQLAYQALYSDPGPQVLRLQMAELTAGLYLLKVIAADGQMNYFTIQKAM